MAGIENPAEFFSNKGTGFSHAAEREGLEVEHFVNKWESAINALRMGNLSEYNYYALKLKAAKIQPSKEFLDDFNSVALDNDNYKDPEVLAQFRRLAEYQDA